MAIACSWSNPELQNQYFAVCPTCFHPSHCGSVRENLEERIQQLCSQLAATHVTRSTPVMHGVAECAERSHSSAFDSELKTTATLSIQLQRKETLGCWMSRRSTRSRNSASTLQKNRTTTSFQCLSHSLMSYWNNPSFGPMQLGTICLIPRGSHPDPISKQFPPQKGTPARCQTQDLLK